MCEEVLRSAWLFFHWTGKSPIQPIFTGLYWEWEQRSRTGHWRKNGENFKYWMGIQPSPASAKKFRKLSRSPIWGFYSVAVVYNAGIDRDICLIDIGSGLICHKALRHSFISSRFIFENCWSGIEHRHGWIWLPAKAKGFGNSCCSEKSATSEIEDHLCDSLSSGTFQCWSYGVRMPSETENCWSRQLINNVQCFFKSSLLHCRSTPCQRCPTMNFWAWTKLQLKRPKPS